MNKFKFIFLGSLSCALLMSSPAGMAYLGPGAGLSAIGSLLALIGAVLFAIVGFLWFPIKRMIKGKKKNATERSSGENESND